MASLDVKRKILKAMNNKDVKELTDYEKYCKMMAQQQEDDMEDLLIEEELKEYQPEGVFVRGH